MTRRPRFFSDVAWENLAVQEAEDRRREASITRSQVTPEMAQRAADLSFAYPDLNAGVIGGLTQMGMDPFTPEVDQIAARNAQLEQAGLNAPPQQQGFWDVGLGRAFKATTRTAFTFFQSLYDEAIKGSTAYLYGIAQGKDAWGMGEGSAARGAFGLSPGAIAASRALRRQEVDLGTGFFAGGQIAEESAMRQQAIGTKLAGTDLAISPGRVVASAVTEPGTTAFNTFSGALDFGANIFLDPANKLGGFVSDLRASNKFLAGGLVDGHRPSMLGRTVTDWLGTRHGDRVAQSIADTDDYLTLHGLFRKNAPKSNVDARFIRQLADTTDKNEVKQLLETIARGGAGGAGQLKELPVGQTIGGRMLGARSAPAGVASLLMRGIGLDDTNVTVNGLRSVIKRDSTAISLLSRLGAEVGMTALRVEDVSGSVDDFGQWLKASGFADERVSHYMGEMARLQDGGLETSAQMYGIVKGAVREFGDQLQKEGLPAPVVKAFTQMFDSVADYRKFWIDQAGNPQFFPGSQYTIMANGQLHTIPSAQLFSEFVAHSVPLPDIRRMRKALNRKVWAQAGFENVAGKMVKREGISFKIENMESWDDLGPGVVGSLMGKAMQDVWKPLVLLRVAWPIRVISEEQVRMLAAGLDSGINHPLRGIMLAMDAATGGRLKTQGRYLPTDVTGANFEDAVEYLAALSRRGMEFGREGGRAMYTDEWIRAAQNTPEYWRGLAIEFQQLADDPIASVVARKLIDAADEIDDIAGVDTAAVLREIKDSFWNGELADMRSALAVDGNRWDLVNVREAADAYIDSLYGRIVHKAGGDVVWADTVKGQWHDIYGNTLERLPDGRYRNPTTGQEIELPNAPPPGLMMVKELSEELRQMRDNFNAQFSEFLNMSPEDAAQMMDLPDWDALMDELDNLERFQEALRQMDPAYYSEMADDWPAGYTPREFREWLRDYADDIAMNQDPNLIRQLQDHLRTQRGITSELQELALRAADQSGRMNLRALDLMELSGKPELLRQRFAGYTPSAGMPTLDELAEKQGWTIAEIRAALAGTGGDSFGRITVRSAPDHVPSQGVHIWTEPIDRFTETKWIANDGWTTGYITISKNADGSIGDVEMFSVAAGPKRIPDGASKAIPGESTDAMRLIKHVIEENGGTTEDIATLAFNNVPLRDWLASAGLEAENMTLLEMVDALRQQHGAAWSGRTSGPLGDLPSIELSGDGAAQMAAHVLRTTRKAADDPTGVRAWPAQRQFYQATRAPDADLLRVIADGQVDGATLSLRNALDEMGEVDRVRVAGQKLQNLYSDRMDILPQYTKVAKEADPQKLNSAVDHMFDLLMSRPTNTMSRSPAFKQFYYKRIAELMPYMDEPTRAAALRAARDAGVGRGDLRSMVRAAFSTQDVTATKLDQMADDFIKGRFKAGTGDITSLDDADEIAKAFALHETKALLYDLSKKTNFFDMTRNLFPFGEAWYEIMTTWTRLIAENPGLVRRMQQGIQGARDSGFFYSDPSTGEEIFGMPGYDKLAQMWAGLPEESEGEAYARPTFTGRVEGLNLVLGNFLPGVGPIVQLPAAAFAQDFMEKPEMRWARDLVFPFGYPDADTPAGLVNSVMPAWFNKALVGLARPTADDERLYNNTVIDVLRAMELNGELSGELNAEQRAAKLEEAKKRARRIYQIRALSQFIGPTGAQVRWDVELDPEGEAFAFQVLATEYRKMIEDNRGDRVQAFQEFVNRFGFDPASIATAKTEQIRPGTVTEYGLDFEKQNPELFRDYGLTAYYAAPDPAEAEFNYNAYLAQLESGDRVPLNPDQWLTERNRLLGSIAYERLRRNIQSAGVKLTDPRVAAYLRWNRYQLMEDYPGYGYENVGVAAQADRWQFIEEFKEWREDPRLAQTQTGQGLVAYLDQRDRALQLAALEYGVSERGFGNAVSTSNLRVYLLGVGQQLSRQYPDFATVFQRHFQWEVEDPDPVAPSTLAGVDFSEVQDRSA